MPNISEFTVMTHHIAQDGVESDIEIDLQVVTLGGTSDLMCRECTRNLGKPTNWCGHIAFAASSGADQKMIWGPEPGDSPLGDKQFTLLIPVFPTMGMTTPVHLTGGDVEIGKRYIVEWDECPTSNTTEFVCFVSPGEGRNAIRTTLIEYMLADSRRGKDCLAGHHGFSAQKKWAEKTLRTQSNANAMLPEYWSIYTTNWCIYCNDHNPANDPDLVPVGDGSGRFPG